MLVMLILQILWGVQLLIFHVHMKECVNCSNGLREVQFDIPGKNALAKPPPHYESV